MIARDVEEPFGTEADDLPLDELCVNNEINLRDLLNQAGERRRIRLAELLTQLLTTMMQDVSVNAAHRARRPGSARPSSTKPPSV